MKEKYPSFLTPDSKPFDPLELAEQTEKIVCDHKERKYTDFYCTGVYSGISTGYTVGCCLRCAFCWVNWSSDFPFKAGQFYELPFQAIEYLLRSGLSFHVAAMTDSRLMPGSERAMMIKKLNGIGYQDYLE